jgi:membrane-associated phospholipid phosphatase
VPYLAYGIAGITGMSRIYDNKHWLSDVVIGSAMGHFITKTVYRIEEAKAKKKQLISLTF